MALTLDTALIQINKLGSFLGRTLEKRPSLLSPGHFGMRKQILG